MTAQAAGHGPEIAEQITVAAPAGTVYAAVAEVRRMARWSPECFAVWVTRRDGGQPRRFVGWNRRGPFLWFTTCRVVTATPGSEFAFDVTTFGQPVARWGFRFSETDGGTQVTEYWQDRRNGASRVLGRIFTGRAAAERPTVNRNGMRETLRRLKRDLEAA
ncbi:Polyketide cyclase / dehydrase and lipid transport [Micromonospora viridifaciens]|uniref:Polyketide cyclase / dehydrase and lipid transport n=1 Tax=Micromonospora viridifaciens TaxID=1881 RepID=A0A1C4WZ80_MICVI|nr:SRPBCC family protein [Micromonospora viridifaciens]SCF01515.1 Polyketide cyclase / dehydrase and lipid transport [Micromonospora viridifaciens]